MLRFFAGRLILIPLVLLAVNFLVFAYARTAQQAMVSANPFYAAQISRVPLMDEYRPYLTNALRGELGDLGQGRGTVLNQVATATKKSVGLLSITFVLSIAVGLMLGLLAVKTRPPGAAGWLVPITSMGLALPSFFVGSAAMGAMLLMIYHGIGKNPFPFNGFGWDNHLVLPVFTLMLRPTVQIAQLASRLLGEEMDRPHVIAGRAFGFTWNRIRWRTALRPILAPLLVGIGGAFRVTLGELLLVETLFNWQGLGQLLVTELAPIQTTSGGTAGLNSAPLATYLTIFTLLFLIVDLVLSLLVRNSDPRLRQGFGEVARG